MAQKSFKNSPALQFISNAREEEERERAQSVPAIKSEAEAIPEGYKRNPEYIEVKSKRVQLVFQPSLYEKVKRNAKANGVSVNEYVHRVLRDATENS